MWTLYRINIDFFSRRPRNLDIVQDHTNHNGGFGSYGEGIFQIFHVVVCAVNSSSNIFYPAWSLFQYRFPVSIESPASTKGESGREE